MKKEDKVCGIKTSIGGQALMEGIMMRGPKRTAMAVRNPEGEIVVEEWDTKSKERAKFFKLPIIRGVFNFADSMIVGYKCLMRSAEISGLEELEEEERRAKEAKKAAKAAKKAEKRGETIPETKPEAAEDKKEDKKGGSEMTAMVGIISILLSIVLVFGLFIFLPNFIGTLILGENAATEHPIWLAVISGTIKVVLLVSYMALMLLIKDIRFVIVRLGLFF